MARKEDKKGDSFGKTDIAQLLTGTFVIVSGTFMGQDKLINLLPALVVISASLVVTIGIFAITSAKRRGILLRMAVTIPTLFIFALVMAYAMTGGIAIGNVLIHTATALPISAGIDALKE